MSLLLASVDPTRALGPRHVAAQCSIARVLLPSVERLLKLSWNRNVFNFGRHFIPFTGNSNGEKISSQLQSFIFA
jgi:hypothetical protein